jgi:hypothetical protein
MDASRAAAGSATAKPVAANGTGRIDRWDAVLLAILLLALVGCTWCMRTSYIDDALIFSRYAHNLIHGLGWVYNAGDTVNAATSPLFVLVTAGLGWLVGDVLNAMPYTFALPMAAIVLLVYRHFRDHGRLAATVAALLVVMAPRFYYTMGMETPLLAALAFGACVASSRQRHVLAGALVGAAVLARPDAAILGLMLLARAIAAGRREAIRFVVVAAAVAVPWFVYATAAFGSPLPNTLAVKLAQRHIWGEPPLFLKGAWRELYLIDERGAGLPPWLWIAVCATAFATIARRARQHCALALFVVFAACQFLAYAIADVPPYSWYLAPSFLACALAAAVLVATLLRSRRPGPFLASTVVAATWIATTMPELQHRAPLHPAYEFLGRWFAANTPPTATIAAADIGVIGFLAKPRTIIDMHGLVVPDAASLIASGDTGWWFDRFRPDYIVMGATQSGICEVPVVARVDFQRDYRRVDGLPRMGCVVYARREAEK